MFGCWENARKCRKLDAVCVNCFGLKKIKATHLAFDGPSTFNFVILINEAKKYMGSIRNVRAKRIVFLLIQIIYFIAWSDLLILLIFFLVCVVSVHACMWFSWRICWSKLYWSLKHMQANVIESYNKLISRIRWCSWTKSLFWEIFEPNKRVYLQRTSKVALFRSELLVEHESCD